MPSNKTMAYIEFIEDSSARIAFKNLSYKRYHNLPIYLEWAPIRHYDNNNNNNNSYNNNNSNSNDNNKDVILNSTIPTLIPQKINETDKEFEYGTIYIKNLNFKSTVDDIKNHIVNNLKCCMDDDIRGIVIPSKSNNKLDSKITDANLTLSVGYGFIEVTSNSLANKLAIIINNTVLDGHKLQAKISEKRITKVKNKNESNDNITIKNDQEECISNKLIIRNIAFQANLDEIKKLCNIYGSIKTIRLPKKVINANNSNINQHRGFAFVEYHSKKEAALAYEQLKLVHLYGRHLVCEYSQDNEEYNTINETKLNNHNSSNKIESQGNHKSMKQLREKAKSDINLLCNNNEKYKKQKLNDTDNN